jgi:putative membrane protein
MQDIKKYLLTSVKGACMGAADVIPGVSGGTIAFILGIYEKWVEAIRELTSIDFIKGIFTRKIKIWDYLKS